MDLDVYLKSVTVFRSGMADGLNIYVRTNITIGIDSFGSEQLE